MRAFDAGDVAAAIRGCRMLKLSDAELAALIEAHAPKTEMFASVVITAAARAVRKGRCRFCGAFCGLPTCDDCAEEAGW